MENVRKYINFKDVKVNNNIVLSIEEASKSAEAIKKTERVFKIITTILTYAFILALAITVLFPFYWMIITSLKQRAEIIQQKQTFFPSIVMWSNYMYVFEVFDFTTYMKNTIIVAIFSTAGTLLTTIFAAFAFARLKFRGNSTVFAIFLMTMMIPGEMMVISNYITVNSFGWISNQTAIKAYLAMIVPFMVSVFHIYLLRQNFKQIPNELYLAAKVDGKSDWSFLWQVMVPLAMPTLTTIFILKLMGAWNSYVWPNLIATGNKNVYLITNGLRETFSVADNVDDYGAQMAATVIVTVPLLLLFVFFRKYIMRGVGRAGIKG